MIMTRITAKALPYDYDALAPAISAETLKFHHDKHYMGYINKLNELIEETPFANMKLENIMQRSGGTIFNNAAQIVNHEFYFDQFSPTPKSEPSGRLLDSIVARFGSFDRFKGRMHSCATSLFGSGWVWLVNNDHGALSVVNEINAGNPTIHGVTPLLTIDVWEHAYYVDYRNDRSEAVTKIWDIIDWAVIERRFNAL